MAIWQFRSWVVPEGRLETGDGAAIARELRESTSSAWSKVGLDSIKAKASQLLLPLTGSWHAGNVLWGWEDGSYLRVLQDGGEVREVEVGIDARSVDWQQLERLSAFLKGLNARLVTADGVVVDGSSRALATALRQSRAWSFVLDPRAFLESLGIEK